MRRLAERDWKATGGGVVNLHKRHQESGVDDCMRVVENMAALWIGGEMEFWFRPSTLFRPKHFDEYLNAKRRPAVARDDFRQQQFRIKCTAATCQQVWMRSVVVPSTSKFKTEEWLRKNAEEAFASAVDHQGVECSCRDANVIVEPVA